MKAGKVGAVGTKDDNGFACIPYEDTRDGVDKRIHRERLVELMFEWNHFFDVRRWKVADMAVGDDHISNTGYKFSRYYKNSAYHPLSYPHKYPSL